MGPIMIEEEMLAPPGFRFTAYVDDCDNLGIGVGDTRGDAVHSLLRQLGVVELVELVWAAEAYGTNAAWLPLFKAEIEGRK